MLEYDAVREFIEFKIKLNFERETVITQNKNLENILENWLNNIEDVDVKRELENEIVCLRNAKEGLLQS